MSLQTLQPTLEFLRRHAPFDRMSAPHLEFLAKRLQLRYFSSGEAITSPGEGPAEHFYIIKQGRVLGEAPGAEAGAISWELLEGECFPIGALLGHRPVNNTSRAAEESICYQLPRSDYVQLLQLSPVFHDFCTRRLANLLDKAMQQAQARTARRVTEANPLSTPIKALIQAPPVTAPPATPIRQVLETMAAERIGSMVICDEAGGVLGIFTLQDLLRRVTLADRRLDDPIEAVMTPDPQRLSGDALAYEAALMMARHAIRHICVVDQHRLIGVVSERRLFALQQVGVANLAQAIANAESIDDLAPLSGDIHTLVEQLLAQGADVGHLTQLITALNDKLTTRAIDLTVASHPGPLPPFQWIAFGSEGRGEQTLKTDQDNGILFTPPEGMSAQEVRGVLLPLAEKVNSALAELGFPLCPGKIMAGNPECCLSAEEWSQRFERWIDQGTPEHLLNASIFFDCRTLYGAAEPLEQLRRRLLERTGANSRFRHQLAANALNIRPPLGLFGEFRLSREEGRRHTLDLKLHGLTPFVDAARIFALANGIAATNTVERLQRAAEVGALNADDVAAWCDSYQFIQLLRMRHHGEQEKGGQPLDNRIDPDRLNDLERRILKEAFRQGRKIQARLALEYQL